MARKQIIGIGDPQSGERKFKKPARGKNINGHKVGAGGGYREDGSAPGQVGVDVKGYPRPTVGGMETLVRRKTQKAAVSNGGVLNGNYHGARGQAVEAVHEGKKHIPAPKAVVLHD